MITATEKPEPVGHLYTIAGVQHCTITQELPDCALYTHPADREPLSEDQITDGYCECKLTDAPSELWFQAGVRCAEAAHGIGAKP